MRTTTLLTLIFFFSLPLLIVFQEYFQLVHKNFLLCMVSTLILDVGFLAYSIVRRNTRYEYDETTTSFSNPHDVLIIVGQLFAIAKDCLFVIDDEEVENVFYYFFSNNKEILPPSTISLYSQVPESIRTSLNFIDFFKFQNIFQIDRFFMIDGLYPHKILTKLDLVFQTRLFFLLGFICLILSYLCILTGFIIKFRQKILLQHYQNIHLKPMIYTMMIGSIFFYLFYVKVLFPKLCFVSEPLCNRDQSFLLAFGLCSLYGLMILSLLFFAPAGDKIPSRDYAISLVIRKVSIPSQDLLDTNKFSLLKKSASSNSLISLAYSSRSPRSPTVDEEEREEFAVSEKMCNNWIGNYFWFRLGGTVMLVVCDWLIMLRKFNATSHLALNIMVYIPLYALGHIFISHAVASHTPYHTRFFLLFFLMFLWKISDF